MSDARSTEVVLEVLYLDGRTCDPCRTTIDTVDEAAAVLAARLERDGRALVVRRVHVTDPDQAAALGFTSSPTVRVDGVDIELEVHERHCGSCSALAGTPVDCRTFGWQGERYSAPPVEMIVERVLDRLAGARHAPPATGTGGGGVERFLGARAATRS